MPSTRLLRIVSVNISKKYTEKVDGSVVSSGEENEQDSEDEWEDDYKDHYPANGHINFSYGTDGSHSCSSFLIKPKVGDFYVFPSYLFHSVYPFYTKGERRSFSMNMIFSRVDN